MKGYSKNYWSERSNKYNKTNWVNDQKYMDTYLGLLPHKQFDNILEDARLADAHALPFMDNSFDLIYMRNVIHYLDDPALAFSEIFRCLKPNRYFLFSQVIPPDDSISEEYDWLIGRNIHYPTQAEILDTFDDFKIVKHKKFILEKQSVLNWLNNTCNDDSKKAEIIEKHHKTSNRYKELAKFETEKNDILVNIKHMIILGKK